MGVRIGAVVPIKRWLQLQATVCTNVVIFNVYNVRTWRIGDGYDPAARILRQCAHRLQVFSPVCQKEEGPRKLYFIPEFAAVYQCRIPSSHSARLMR
jgi:hypothetical protein